MPKPLSLTGKQIYWLYHNGQPLTSVILPLGSSNEAIREAACKKADICCNRPYETPFEFEQKCRMAEIRI
jgi:hypothetical protein